LILTENDYVTLCITDHTHPPETDKLRNREKLPFDGSVLEHVPMEQKRTAKSE
jgi:hypothetical protein